MEERILSGDKAIELSEEWIQFVDENVLAELPQGTEVIGTFPHGASYWSRTAEIQTDQADGSPMSFFIKLTQGPVGKAMVSGEFVSMTSLHRTIPGSTPIPIAWGTHACNPSIHFFLCQFVEMLDEVPDIQMFTAKIAELHKKGISPNGRYGFPVPTYLGRMAQYTTWTESWEEFFTNYVKRLLLVIEEAQGPDMEFRDLLETTIDKVIPRLLRPLETGGRQIQPRLVHGDLYAGNVSVHEATGAPIVYDATCLYAHNEWDLAGWRPIRHKIGKPYVKAYFRHFPISAPEEDQDDRNALYCLKWDMKGAAIYPDDPRYKKYCMDVMRALIEKYPNGYEGWAKERGEELAPSPQRTVPDCESDV